VKRAVAWIMAAALWIFLVDWGVMGVKIFTGDYDILPQAWIGLVCFVILLLCVLYRLLNRKCPHCGRIRLDSGSYCSHCGKEC